MIERRLARGLNDFVDERYALVPREFIEAYAGSDWIEIRRFLTLWEQQGYLEILKDPQRSTRFEPCIRLKNFIGADAPLGAFWGLLRDEMPPVYQARWQKCLDGAGNSNRPLP